MQTSAEIKNIAAAIAAFQQADVTVIKDATNGGFKGVKYATLSNVLETITVPLKEAGLCFVQFPEGDGLTTRLMHPASGEWMEATLTMKPTQNTPQAIGSAITYARRYALCAVLGLSVEDDDGAAGSAPKPKANGQTNGHQLPPSQFDAPAKLSKATSDAIYAYVPRMPQAKAAEVTDWLNSGTATEEEGSTRLRAIKAYYDAHPHPAPTQ